MSLAAKLEARRKQCHQAEVAKLEKKEQLDADDELRNQLRQKKQEESLQGSKMSNYTPENGKQGESTADGLPKLTGWVFVWVESSI